MDIAFGLHNVLGLNTPRGLNNLWSSYHSVPQPSLGLTNFSNFSTFHPPNFERRCVNIGFDPSILALQFRQVIYNQMNLVMRQFERKLAIIAGKGQK